MAIGSNEVTTRSADNLSRLCGQQVSITFGDENKQYFCFCWGACRGRFFMTQIPMDADIQGKLVPGASVIVRFVESGLVCGFKTRIYKTLTHPFRMIFFEYPDSVDVVNLRAFKRVPIFLQATIQWHGEEYEGAIRDLSEAGCFFVMKYWRDKVFDDLGMGSTFKIRFTVHDEEIPTEIGCKVVRVNKDQEELRMGLSFKGDRQKTVRKIAGFIAYIRQLLEDKASN